MTLAQNAQVPLFTVFVLAAASPASATPYHLIRWQDTGFCQIWDQRIPTTPRPATFSIVSEELCGNTGAPMAQQGLTVSTA